LGGFERDFPEAGALAGPFQRGNSTWTTSAIKGVSTFSKSVAPSGVTRARPMAR
jgi:hypothetical protein